MESQDVTVTIHGRDYKIRSFRDEDETKNIARYVDWTMKNLEAKTGSTDYLKLAVLSLMQVANNYFELKEAATETGPEAEKEIKRLTKLLEDAEKEIGLTDASATKKKTGS